MKQKIDCFQMMKQQINLSAQAAKLIREMLTDCKPQEAYGYRLAMRKLEHEGDEARHRALRKRSRELVTPIERAADVIENVVMKNS